MAVRLIRPKRFADGRGWFVETYNRRTFESLGIGADFCQDNHSLSLARGTLRGLHYQRPPHAQAKLVRCVRGRVWDVAVDIRAGSPTWAQWVAIELNAENGFQLFIPAGFAHGFLTLEPNSEVEYKVSDHYAAACDDGVLWNDPDLALPWPLGSLAPVISEKDQGLPLLSAAASPFVFDGVPLAPLEA